MGSNAALSVEGMTYDPGPGARRASRSAVFSSNRGARLLNTLWVDGRCAVTLSML